MAEPKTTKTTTEKKKRSSKKKDAPDPELETMLWVKQRKVLGWFGRTTTYLPNCGTGTPRGINFDKGG
jgi:hypothetical protein